MNWFPGQLPIIAIWLLAYIPLGGVTPFSKSAVSDVNDFHKVEMKFQLYVSDTLRGKCLKEDIYFSGLETIEVIGWTRNKKMLVEVLFNLDKVQGIGLQSGKPYVINGKYSSISQGRQMNMEFDCPYKQMMKVQLPGSNSEINVINEGNIVLFTTGAQALKRASYRLKCS